MLGRTAAARVAGTEHRRVKQYIAPRWAPVPNRKFSSTLYDYVAKHSAWAIRVIRLAGIYCGSRFGGDR